MEYKGKLYAKIAGKYIECTESVEQLENKIKALELSEVALKDALMMRNVLIQGLDKEVICLKEEVADLDNQLFERNVSIQAIEKVNELLDLIEETKNAYAWWIDEKGMRELDKSDYEHFEKLVNTLKEHGRTDH